MHAREIEHGSAHTFDVALAVDLVAGIFEILCRTVFEEPRVGVDQQVFLGGQRGARVPHRDARNTRHAMAGDAEQVGDNRTPRRVKSHRVSQDLHEGVVDYVFCGLPAVAHGKTEAQQGCAMSLIQLACRRGIPASEAGNELGILGGQGCHPGRSAEVMNYIAIGKPKSSLLVTVRPRRDRVQRGPSITNRVARGTLMGLGRPAEPGRHERKASEEDENGQSATSSGPRETRRRRNRSASPIKDDSEGGSDSAPSTLPTLSAAHAYFMNTFGPAERQAPDVNVFLTRKIMRFARRWRAIANEHLAAIGHTQARWEALYWIAVSQGGATQRELAECVGIEEPTLVRMLHRLEQEGLVERRASQADRRTKTIVLTKAAEPHLKAMSGVIDQLREDVLQGLSAEEITQAVSVLDRLLERLERP